MILDFLSQSKQEFKRELFLDSFKREKFVLKLFQFQAHYNKIYHKYVQGLSINIAKITSIHDIPYLPIRFFKEQNVSIGDSFEEGVVFRSSGTGGNRSTHIVSDLEFYLQNAQRLFESTYGDLSGFEILALLPSYLEQGESSLVAMVDHFIKVSMSERSDFYLNDFNRLAESIQRLKFGNKKVLLIGVTYALLDFVQQFHIDFPEIIVMETGGMKGRRKEMLRIDVHDRLSRGFNTNQIHSEYGMTELLSQAYSHGHGVFKPNKTFIPSVRQINDPFETLPVGKQGILRIIDLANIDSCAFIETQDLAKMHENGSFEVLGRVDNSDLRGCNLLYS